MKNLRHVSLKMNGNKTTGWGHDSELEILVKKIKVKKCDIISYFLEINSDYIPICTTCTFPLTYEVCVKVLSEKYAYKSVKTALLLSNVIDADHQNSCLFTNKDHFHQVYGF